jgi:hypothetical protein
MVNAADLKSAAAKAACGFEPHARHGQTSTGRGATALGACDSQSDVRSAAQAVGTCTAGEGRLSELIIDKARDRAVV